MNHRKSVKLAAFLLSGMMVTQGTTGIIPGLKQSSILDNSSLSASALDLTPGEYYSSPRDWDDDNNDDRPDFYSNSSYQFFLNKKNKTALINGVKNKNSTTLKIPASISYNGISYKVVALDSIGYSSLKEVTIPSTITELGSSAFTNAYKLTTVKFQDNKSGLTKVCGTSFNSSCPFMANQYKANSFTVKGSTNAISFAVIGDCLINFINYKDPDSYSSVETVKPENNTAYDNIKYFSRGAFSDFSKIKTLYLPKKFESGNGNAFSCNYRTLENVMYWKSNRFYNLADNIKLDTFSSEAKKVAGSTIIPDNHPIGKNLSQYFVKNILEELKISYKGSVWKGYDAWQQYQIVSTLYKYVEAYYYHYSKNYDKSPSYLDEMVSIELLGKTAKKSCGINCVDFAALFKELCIGAGIEVYIVSSNSHEYNAVKIGEKWFNIDACWQHIEECFLTNDTVIKSSDDKGAHIPVPEIVKPSCDTSFGDINDDKKIDSEDAQLILNAYTELLSGNKPKLTPLQMVLCDVDRSGSIDSRDANLVLSYYSEMKLGGFNKSFEKYLQFIIGSF